MKKKYYVIYLMPSKIEKSILELYTHFCRSTFVELNIIFSYEYRFWKLVFKNGYVDASKYTFWYGVLESESRVSGIDMKLLCVRWIILCICMVSCSQSCDELNLFLPIYENSLESFYVYLVLKLFFSPYGIQHFSLKLFWRTKAFLNKGDHLDLWALIFNIYALILHDHDNFYL